MRIVHLINNLGWVGGLETYVLSLAPVLAEKGIDQAIVYAQKGDDVSLDATLIPFSEASVQNTVDAVAAFRPTLVHVHNLFSRELFAALLDRYPLMFTTHNYKLICPATNLYLKRPRVICQTTFSWRCLSTSVQHRCMPLRPPHVLSSYRVAQWAHDHKDRIAHLVCPCDYAAVKHRAAGFPDERMTVLPYFCDLPPLQQPRSLPATPTITFMGRIRPYKGITSFIKMLAALPAAVQGKIVGDLTPTTEQSIMDVARTHGVAERLACQAWVGRDGIRDVFKETTVFVFSSIWPETLGIVGLEALATGVPVVAFDVGGVREWLIPNETGFLADVKDHQAAAQSIESIIFDPEALYRMGEAGLALIRSKFSMDRHVSHLTSIYQEVAREAGGTNPEGRRAVHVSTGSQIG